MKLCRAGIWLYLGLVLTPPVLAQQATELDEIRQQMEQLRTSYEAQLKALEERLDKAEALSEKNRVELAESQDAAGSVTGSSGGLTSSAFNPAISVILQGSLNSYSKNPDSYELAGFPLGGEAGLASEGFSLDETEVTASASIDQWFYAESTFAFHDNENGDGEVEVEEAYVDPLMLPAGLGGRIGRFYSDVGYLNRFHTHTWDFRDAPLTYRAFLGKQYRDDGIRLNWIAPTDLYLMLGAETYAGKRFPAGENSRVLGNVQTAYLKLGGDIGISHAWQGGMSALRANAKDRNSGDSDFTGDSDLYIADLVYRWAPNGNPRQRNLKLQTEYFYRKEDGDVTVTDNTNSALVDYDGDQKGWYAQAVYQFMPHWRAGLRYDWLNADNHLKVTNPGGFTDPNDIIAATGLDKQGHDPQRWSLMVDWSPSEFSRIRAQYDRDESRPQGTDHQLFLQYIMSLGSHGAHEF